MHDLSSSEAASSSWSVLIFLRYFGFQSTLVYLVRHFLLFVVFPFLSFGVVARTHSSTSSIIVSKSFFR